MTRLALAALIAVLLAALAHADGAPVSPCVNALEQLTTLQTAAPVYKPAGTDSRAHLDDAKRPAEIARLKSVISTACSTDSRARQSDEAEAKRLHSARSPECAIEHDNLAMMEQPSSRESPDSIAAQRKLVAAECPTVPIADVWLLEIIWNRR